MSWFWSSPPQPPPQEQPKAPPPTEQAPAPNEPVDPEVQKFLGFFKTDDGGESTKHQPQTTQTSPPSSASAPDASPSITSWLSLRSSSRTNEQEEAPLLDPLSESLLPTDMSCRQAFDLAWSCNGLGGQFNSVYRHGNMRSCSEHWDDFWFCMRTRAHTGHLKASMIRTHYRNKAYRKYGQGRPSSEDVWERRNERLPPGAAFNIPIGGTEVIDEPSKT